MKKKIVVFLLVVFAALSTFFTNGNIALADNGYKVILGGNPAGFCIQTRGAYIAGLSDVITKEGILSPSKSAGLSNGDVIYYINGTEINNAADIENVLKDAEDTVEVDYKRCGNSYTATVSPATDLTGQKKLGLFIKDDVSGIGTVTFIDGNKIATLGHPVLDENGKIMQVQTGKIYNCNVTGYVRGERGNPGELRGVIMKNEEIATIDQNKESGVFGTVYASNDKNDNIEIETGEGKMGDAFIYTTINGEKPKRYSVSIVKADNVLSDTKNYVLKITDKELLETTGGIVQGMSGSPIVQNGKLIGAVTHVFINDPTRGFGISINNMLNK